MIGVLASNAEHPVIREFFELFKTPWEFYRSGAQYEVLICTGLWLPDNSAKLVLVYGAGQKPFDQQKGIELHSQRANTVLSYKGSRIPIYGSCITFERTALQTLLHESTQRPAALEISSNGQKLVRIGFDLFQEIRHLLTRGQPVAQARIPALELHITVVRDLILGCGIALLEIPPIPAGYNFVVCLTHDVDHAGIKNHKCDHTMFGFLYRAFIGSLIDLFRGRKSLKHVAVNWMAAFSLPLVHLGLAKDFWIQCDRYVDIEKGLTSTFFVIPRKADPGQGRDGPAPSKRATRYDVSEIAGQIDRLLSAHHEIGLHGIDAWWDETKGREELEEIRRVTSASEVGVRMHWLFFDEQSPAVLEKAGFSYDSTIGYNETVGYRAGTTQAFKPLGVEQILELPMHIMDTALFYPAYLNLSPKEARTAVAPLIENAARFGGVLTVNWHDRSIAPERLWDDVYTRLLEDLKGRRAWFATANQAVSWFRKRRTAVIESAAFAGDSVRVKVSLNQSNDDLPGLRVRLYKAAPGQTSSSGRAEQEDGAFVDVACNNSGEIQIAV
jgi:hypothetical protein